jgi:serine/threonine protein phosphatase PrpC
VAAGTANVDVEFGQSTDPGLDPAKRVNEDACGYLETKFGHLFVICDGMGGHAGGKQASDIAIRTIFEHVTAAADGMNPGEVLSTAIAEAGRRVYEFGGPATNQQRPGSTCVSVMLHDGVVEVAHVGDSRAYAIRGKQIYRLTRDHSMVQELLDGGVISEQESIGHPDSNKITRALGMTPLVEVERREEPMEVYEGDVFVLASDGLTDLARNDDILITVTEYLKNGSVQAVCDELVALANRRGGHDNITVQCVRVLKSKKTGITRVQEPGAPFAGTPVAATIEGSPYVGPPIIQPSDPGRRPTAGLAVTAPDQPLPTIIDPIPDPLPLLGSSSRSLQNPPAPAVPVAQDRSSLVYVVLAMAAVIGLLLALLMWALFLR